MTPFAIYLLFVISNSLFGWRILSSAQYGFQQSHSTYTAMLDMYDRVSTSIEKNEFSIGLFIDLSKALNTLNHKILLYKLEYYGIRGAPLKWFESYLSNRQQYVYINGVSS